MNIGKLKKAVLDNYKNKSKLGDYWSDEIKEGLDEILNYDDKVILVDDIKTDILDDKIEMSELADGMVDPYTIELLKWYQADLKRCSYADDFMAEMGSGEDFIKILSGGQYMYYSELLNCVIELIKEVLKDLDLEAEEIVEGSESLEKKAEKLEKL